MKYLSLVGIQISQVKKDENLRAKKKELEIKIPGTGILNFFLAFLTCLESFPVRDFLFPELRILVGYANANFAGDLLQRKSTTGNLILLCGSPDSWRC